MFTFFMLTYILQVFSEVKKKYRQLSTAVFELIKEKLNADVKRIVALSESEQRNFAFRYFKPNEIDEIINDRKYAHDLNHTTTESPNREEERNRYKTKCTITNDHLNWKIYNLILLLDKYDTPRIPKRLFDKFANLQLHGCPGPIYMSLLNAFKHLAMMTLFLVFVLSIVGEFRGEVSSSNQLIVTLVGCFIPFILQMILKPKAPKLDLNTYAFQGVTSRIFSEYFDEYPISDISFAADPEIPNCRSSREDSQQGKCK